MANVPMPNPANSMTPSSRGPGPSPVTGMPAGRTTVAVANAVALAAPPDSVGVALALCPGPLVAVLPGVGLALCPGTFVAVLLGVGLGVTPPVFVGVLVGVALVALVALGVPVVRVGVALA